MDFRPTHCQWCASRHAPLAHCTPCPRFGKYQGGKDGILRAHDFCDLCLHRGSTELQVFCSRNRFYQEDTVEDFDCYKFDLDVSSLR